MDDFQKRFPRTVSMVESQIAAQSTMESAQHIHQQRKGDNFSYCGLVDCRSNKNEMCNVKCCRYARRKTTPVA
jgi:hypothetical protein